MCIRDSLIIYRFSAGNPDDIVYQTLASLFHRFVFYDDSGIEINPSRFVFSQSGVGDVYKRQTLALVILGVNYGTMDPTLPILPQIFQQFNPFFVVAPVSYTHLDVYKRQVSI